MNKYILTCTTSWAGTDEQLAFIAEDEDDICQIAEDYAYENFSNCGGIQTLSEELFPDEEELTETQWDKVYQEELESYGWNTRVFEGTDEEWNDLELIYDGNLDED